MYIKKEYKLIFIMMTLILSSIFIIYNRMLINELNGQSIILKKQLELLKNESIAFKTEKEKFINLTYIEKYAKEKLNMTKFDNDKIEYIDVQEIINNKC